MAEQNLIERLDEAIDDILAGRREHLALAEPELAVAEPELAMLLVIAEDLRDLPSGGFKAMLKTQLVNPGLTTGATAIEFPTINPYFVVEGAAEFLDFLKNAFGAEERMRVPMPDGTLMHSELVIGNSIVEAGDANERYAAVQMPLHLYVEDADAVYASAVRAGARSLYEPTNQAYGDREAAVIDRWGNHWYISTRQENAPIPAGFRSVTVGVRVAEGAARLIEFLTNAFDAKELERTTMPDGTIIHGVARIGDSVVELGESHGEWGAMQANVHMFVDDPDATYERAVAAGAESIFAPYDTPYGQRMGAVRDPFGNSWFIAKML